MNGRNKYWREARWDKNQPARLDGLPTEKKEE